MSMVDNIARSWINPRKVIREMLDDGVREELSLFLAMLFGVLNLVARLPALAADAVRDGTSLANETAQVFVSSVFMMPIMLYILAAVVHFIMRVFGGKATYGEARYSLFWAAIVSSPLVLISGLINAFGSFSMIMGAAVITLTFFSYQWAATLTVSEFTRHRDK